MDSGRISDAFPPAVESDSHDVHISATLAYNAEDNITTHTLGKCVFELVNSNTCLLLISKQHV